MLLGQCCKNKWRDGKMELQTGASFHHGWQTLWKETLLKAQLSELYRIMFSLQ